jgi:putative ABC transport system ATP-binding protein
MKTSQEIMELIRRLNRENGQTFVLVTHDIEVGRVCDRIIHMRDGLLVSQNGDAGQIAGEIAADGGRDG